MSWYTTGTISVTNGSATITGSGTAFVANLQPGFAFLGPDYSVYEILSVTSDTVAVLTLPYRGTTASAQSYGIFQTQGTIAGLANQVATLLSTFGPMRDAIPALLAAYSGTAKTFVAGTDFTPGTTTSLTLSQSYTSVNQFNIYFDSAFQGPENISSISGTTCTFTSAIPVGVNKIYERGSVALAVGTPGDATVSAPKLASNLISNLTSAATITGAEVGMVQQASTLFKLSLTNIAAWIVQTYNGFFQTDTGATARPLQSKAREFLSPNDFPGVDSTGITDSTTGLGLFFTAAVARGRGVELTGKYKVTHLVLSGLNGLHIRGDAIITGTATGTYSAVIEILNCTDLTVSGDIVVSGADNPNYTAGVKVWTNASGCSLLKLDGISPVHVKSGIQFGDPAQVDALVSEITVLGGYNYACPNPIVAYGTQTFVNLIGCNYISTTNSAFSGAAEIGILCIGANVTQTGGELLHAASTSNFAIEVRPITSATYGNPYGSYTGTGVTIETAAPLLNIANPSAVSSPTPGIATSFVQCRGYHSQDLAAYVTTDSQFLGDIVFDSNDFYAGPARSHVNIQAGAACNIWCDDKSFGRNFIQPALKGIGGSGVAHFPYRMVLNALNLSGQSLPNATITPLVFTSLDNTGDLSRFSSNYNASTGIFTTPAGGLKNVQIHSHVAQGSLTSAQMIVYINGAQVGGAYMNVYGNVIWQTSKLNSGDTVAIRLFNIASGTVSATGGNGDVFQIFASN